MVNKKMVNFKVNGIHCNGCVSKIKNSLLQIKGEKSVDVDISSGTVKIEFDADQTALNDLKTQIIAVGFSIEGLELE